MQQTTVKRFSSFAYLNMTQFLGALNDNVYKMLIIFFLIEMNGMARSHDILAYVGFIFVIPFILFSSIAGTIADKYSKSKIIVSTKILEVIIIIGGVISFALKSAIGSYIILFLMSVQSAIFGPAKYGIVPELVPPNRISKSNGQLTSFTFLAIIIGTFLASFVTQMTNRNYIASALICLIISIVGLFTSLRIEFTQPSGSSKKMSPRFISDNYRALKVARKHPLLLTTIFGSAFFLFIGAFVQLNIIPFAIESLSLSDVEGGYLFLLTALGIGLGSFVAGKLSGGTVELGLVPFGAMGIALCCLLFGIGSNLWFAIFLAGFLGFSGGFYQVPLDSYIQANSPKTHLGQIVAAVNFLSFLGVLGASFFIYFMNGVLNLSAAQGFIVMGALTLIIAYILYRRYLIQVMLFLERMAVKFKLKPLKKCSLITKIPKPPKNS